MESPLLPIIALKFMVHFKWKAVAIHISNVHNIIHFITELEQNNTLQFLDVLVINKTTSSFHHTICRKPTHIHHYLCASLHHHLAQLKPILKNFNT